MVHATSTWKAPSHPAVDWVSPPVPPTQPSSVAWQVAIWVLLTLSVSSMAQPGCRVCSTTLLRMDRIYFCSSPIFCAVDTLSILVRLPWTSFAFHISPAKAARIVSIIRSGDADPGRHRWPRWVFFIIGTLPAVIKLCSFSGLPWTKAWGIMFTSSYILLEGFFSLSKLDSTQSALSIPEILGYSSTAWQQEENKRIRDRTIQVLARQELVDGIFVLLALLGHAVLSLWAVEDIWLSVSPSVTLNLEHTTYSSVWWISTVIDVIIIVITTILLSLRFFGAKKLLSRWLSLQKLAFMYLFLISCVSMASFLTRKVGPKSGKTVNHMSDAMFILYLILVVWYALQEMFIFVGKRLPALWRRLRGTAQHTSKAPTERDQPGALRWPVVKRGRVVPDTPDELRIRVVGFLFFCFNVCLCVLWYAFRYNPAGTVNPAWTVMFG